MIKIRDRLAIFFLFLTIFLLTNGVTNGGSTTYQSEFKIESIDSISTYAPTFDPLNINEEMTISPMFTPDNALEIHESWINRANDTIDVQNQYLTQFNDSVDWDNDPSPIVRSLVDAHTRGVQVRLQINGEYDSDDITSYFQGKGIEVRWMGNSESSSDGSWVSTTHNKLVIIDNKVTLLSSINFGENAFNNNREAGMVIQSSTVAEYYTSIFEEDWADGEIPPSSGPIIKFDISPQEHIVDNKISYISPTNIPKANFTGTYNVTLFTNPDNADEVIFHYLKSARKSIYVSMYTISRPDFNSTLIDLKKANPGIDIKVLISRRRVHPDENEDTASAAQSLVDNLIPVYNSTKDLNFYHNKYWIIDKNHVFVYSGNWSPRSVSANATSYSSTKVNRDMGIGVLDTPEIADFFKEEVWDKDVNVAEQWELPIGIKQTSFTKSDIVKDTVTLSGQVFGLDNATVSYRFGSEQFTNINLTNNVFSIEFDTTTIPNGITTYEVKAETTTLSSIDTVEVNVINYAPADNWRFLITELLPDPSDISDTEGEYIEFTNSFPFPLLIEGWKVGDDTAVHSFSTDFKIEAYSSIIIARSKTEFENAYSVTAEIDLNIVLSNDGDFVQLLDHHDNFLDIVAYGDATTDNLDGSEVLAAPASGEAILRTKLHIDTDKATDFIFGSPDPKGTVPQVPLITGTETTETFENSFSWSIFLISIVLFPLVRRKLKLRG